MTSDSLSAGARGNPEEATPGAASVLAPDPPYLWRGPLAVAVDEGRGPLVVLLHGFPELPGSWHNQVGPLVEAGYRVVVPYLRGYGYSPILADPAFSAADRLAGDIVGVIDACGEQQAVVVGHDQGADVAWALARLHPERLRGVVGVSVPFVPRRDRPPYELLREASGDRFNYVLYFQEPGVAEAELNPNVERFLASMYSATSGTPTPGAFPDLPAATGTVLQLLPEPDALPAFVDPAIFAESVEMYTRTGFTGGLNVYRVYDLNWAKLPHLSGRTVDVPAAFIAGERDLALAIVPPRFMTPRYVTDLRTNELIPGVGHWVQQEAPEATTDALLAFLRGLDAR